VNYNMKRYWINSPSTSQPNHEWHGTNVLCDVTDKDHNGNVVVYPTSGDISSFVMKPLYLSEGWK